MLPSHPLPLSLLCLVLSLAAPGANALPSPTPQGLTGQVQTIPMMRRGYTRRNASEVDEWLRLNKLATEMKYGMNGHQKRATGMNLLTDLQFDSSYFGSLAVGTPPVSFDVILDTGSADLWLASTGTQDGKSTKGVTLFTPDSSSSFQDLGSTFAIQYGSGSAEGTLGKDQVQFAGFSLDQTFGVVNQTSSSLLTSPLSGLMGLAFQTIASSGAVPFWEALAGTSGSLDQPLFAFQLTRFTNDTSANTLEAGGTFTLGNTNSSLFTGDIDYQSIPDNAPGYWIQELTTLTVNGQSVSVPTGSNAWAAIDTGTTGVGVPADVLQSIFSNVPNSQRRSDGYYQFPCSTQVNVQVGFGGSSTSWPISPADFVLQQIDQTNCVGAFFELDSSGSTAPPFIFGDTFLKNVYSVYRSNPPAVGFATLSSGAISMNNGNAAVPSATIGSVVAVSATSTGSGGGNGGNGGKGNGATPSLQIPFTLVLSSFFGGLFLLWGAI